MKFYLCQTVEGPRYARTQADAKALDPKFKLVEFDTDQASLVAKFNELIADNRLQSVARVPDDDTGRLPTLGVLLAMNPELEGQIKLRYAISQKPGVKALPADYRGHPTDCPSCFRTPKGALHFAKAADKDEIEDQIEHITEGWQLDRLAEAIESRRREITKPAVQPVAPRARVRPATV